MPIDELVKANLKNQEDKFNLMFEQNSRDHEEIKKSMREGFKHQDDRFEEIISMIKEIGEGKANKWVEKFLIWAGAIIGSGLLMFLGNLIYKAIIVLK